MISNGVKSLNYSDYYNDGFVFDDLPLDTIICGDCQDVVRTLPDNCIDLIITSPPYADQRKKHYEGIHPDQYVDWFLPKSEEFYRVLKPDGTFILNIKERVVDGERHTFVLSLILEMKKQGWFWTEEYIWNKKNCFPGKWPNRFRDAWEPCLQFNKSKKFNMYHNSVMVPIGDWSKKRLKNLTQKDHKKVRSKTESGFGRKVANWIGREYVYPTNVLNFATECHDKNHCATYPVDLPDWFIRLFSACGDVVLDPFLGSGTTALASMLNERRFIGIDKEQKFCEIAKTRIDSYYQTQLSKE